MDTTHHLHVGTLKGKFKAEGIEELAYQENISLVTGAECNTKSEWEQQ